MRLVDVGVVLNRRCCSDLVFRGPMPRRFRYSSGSTVSCLAYEIYDKLSFFHTVWYLGVIVMIVIWFVVQELRESC